MHVLVIDDSAATRFMLCKMLRELGHSVYEAVDGKQALDKLRENPTTTLALVDWNMPVMNGLEFVQSVRAEKDFEQLKLMMCTTEIEMMNVVRALEAGANEYVMKPFTKDIIIEKLKIMGLCP
jgi:two-component system chemotaxis response regulator CheY